MEMAVQYERLLNEFFLNIKDLTRHMTATKPATQFNEWSNIEGEIQLKFNQAKDAVHIALCDNIDTRSALDAIRDLVSIVNVYIRDNSRRLNALLLRRVAEYITDMLNIFGAINGPRGGIGFPIAGHTSSNVRRFL